MSMPASSFAPEDQGVLGQEGAGGLDTDAASLQWQKP